MIKDRLSEQEIIDIAPFVATQNLKGLEDHLNRLLYQKGLGTDGCSRPLAFRAEEDTEIPCYAYGYIKKIKEFLNESAKRLEGSQAIKDTLKYINNVQKEIELFFKGEDYGKQ